MKLKLTKEVCKRCSTPFEYHRVVTPRSLCDECIDPYRKEQLEEKEAFIRGDKVREQQSKRIRMLDLDRYLDGVDLITFEDSAAMMLCSMLDIGIVRARAPCLACDHGHLTAWAYGPRKTRTVQVACNGCGRSAVTNRVWVCE